jgi:preprotein translocase subunit SecA
VEKKNKAKFSKSAGMLRHQGRKVGRNEPCPCGSGKKFKKCHLNKGMRGVK